MSHVKLLNKDRYRRSYSPEGLKVLKGPKEDYAKGSRWLVADEWGYARIEYYKDEKALNKDTLYIEDIEVKPHLRGKGYGRSLFLKTQRFAEMIGARWIQLDSETAAVGFWEKMEFKETGVELYAGKTSMTKKVPE
ncbi:MAG: GNAT family N-acetyltransferase [Candidatus Bathyarchaeota archaeon]|nr:GNAT family N-acetyltransferase [Candidatus Bathyarchaeota archaeon]